MAAYTKGPWHVAGGEGEEDIISDAGDMIASIYAGDVEEGAENARLIAAAPELFEALVLALPYVEAAEADETYKRGAVRSVVNAMRTAIAGAEGIPA